MVEETKSGHMVLDLGCGLGQDIRRLVWDGAPEKSIVGLDLHHAFIALGYELFKDEGTLDTSFLCQDFWEDTPEISSLAKNIKIINSGYFMHLWDWDTQLKAAKRMIQLVSPTGGSMIAGIHFGSHSAGTWSNGPLEFRSMFLHNEKSLSELWKQAGKETQTHWKFECLITEDDDCKELHPEGCRLRWVAELEES
ncbi:uncharacterized protein N7503_010186 [Penicillium pulvis]|uniref:uncharacterized protein n=1 Tax=Penicillium pulvis TaxID=1562058 RepID=UPI0025469102|nr:uncharacterized protein N7503_010186 [Penicillium pulvis]KAJ5784974.1 hypothetical protein N7503_010186 [Penicillium pulvis]